MRIGVDLDDVLANFVEAFVNLAHETYGRPEKGKLPVDWEWSNMGLSPEEINNLWVIIKSTPFFWQDLDRAEGVSHHLLKALDQEHELFFITARVPTGGDTVKNQSADWLTAYGVRYPTVLVEADKGPLAAALKLEAFIDDRPKNIIEIKAVLPNCRMFLKNASHNLAYNPPPGVERVNSFNAFANIILEGYIG